MPLQLGRLAALVGAASSMNDRPPFAWGAACCRLRRGGWSVRLARSRLGAGCRSSRLYIRRRGSSVTRKTKKIKKIFIHDFCINIRMLSAALGSAVVVCFGCASVRLCVPLWAAFVRVVFLYVGGVYSVLWVCMQAVKGKRKPPQIGAALGWVLSFDF